MGSGRGGINCVCYWGCGNTANIIVWAVFAVCCCLGIGLLVGGAVDGQDCFQKFQDCQDNGDTQSSCQDKFNKQCNLSKYQGLVASGCILLFLITPLLTSYFCCCAKRPGDPSLPQGTSLTVVSQPLAYPQQPGYYPPPPPGQYQPGYAPPAQYPPGQFRPGQNPYPPPMAYPPPQDAYAPAPGAHPPVPAAYPTYPPAANPGNQSISGAPTAFVSVAPASAEPPKQV